jgi:hypothetical protein
VCGYILADYVRLISSDINNQITTVSDPL